MAFAEEIGRHEHGQTFVDSENTKRFRTDIAAQRLWKRDPVSGLYKRHQSIADGVRHASAEVKATGTDVFEFLGADGNPLGTKQFGLERQIDVDTWEAANLTRGTSPTERDKTDDSGTWEWVGDGPAATVTMEFVTTRAGSKWRYRVVFKTPGTYRGSFVVRPSRRVESFRTSTAKILGAWQWDGAIRSDRPPCTAKWRFAGTANRLNFRWLDLWRNDLVDPDATIVTQDLVQVRTVPIVVTQGAVDRQREFVLDPTVDDFADWSADVEFNGGYTKYEGDGSEWLGTNAAAYRVPIIYTISAVTQGDNIDSVDADITVTATDSWDDKTYAIHPYNSDGTGDPDADTAEDAFNRAGAGTAYVTGQDFGGGGTGVKQVTLGAAANTDVKDIRDASGTTYAIGYKGDDEDIGADYIEFGEYGDAQDADKPEIHIVHSAAATNPERLINGGNLLGGGLLVKGTLIG